MFSVCFWAYFVLLFIVTQNVCVEVEIVYHVNGLLFVSSVWCETIGDIASNLNYFSFPAIPTQIVSKACWRMELDIAYNPPFASLPECEVIPAFHEHCTELRAHCNFKITVKAFRSVCLLLSYACICNFWEVSQLQCHRTYWFFLEEVEEGGKGGWLHTFVGYPHITSKHIYFNLLHKRQHSIEFNKSILLFVTINHKIHFRIVFNILG